MKTNMLRKTNRLLFFAQGQICRLKQGSSLLSNLRSALFPWPQSLSGTQYFRRVVFNISHASLFAPSISLPVRNQAKNAEGLKDGKARTREIWQFLERAAFIAFTAYNLQNLAKQLGQEALDSRNCRTSSGHCYWLLQHSSKELHRWQEGTREVQVINSKRRGTRKLIAQEM